MFYNPHGAYSSGRDLQSSCHVDMRLHTWCLSMWTVLVLVSWTAYLSMYSVPLQQSQGNSGAKGHPPVANSKVPAAIQIAVSRRLFEWMSTNSLMQSVQRRDSCKGCFQRPYSFILEARQVCNGSSDIDLVVFIHSAPSNIHTRNLMRSTWINALRADAAWRARYVFLVGYSALDGEVEKESLEFGDIALQTFTDAYLNLTLKTLMGLEWVGRYCPRARLVMKTDDDVLVNVPNVLSLLHHLDTPHLLHGQCFSGRKPIRDGLINKQFMKWYTPYWSFPHRFYPPYCYGIGYIVSAQTAADILAISQHVPFFEWEDVYIGLCIKALDYNVRMIKGLELEVTPKNMKNCSTYQRTKWGMATQFNMSMVQWIWNTCILPMMLM